ATRPPRSTPSSGALRRRGSGFTAGGARREAPLALSQRPNPANETGMQRDPLVIAGRSFSSRLIVGTGKHKDVTETEAAIDASGAEIVTVALRRVDLSDRSDGSLMALLGKKKWTLLPNTAGCYTADEAVRTLRLARELGIASLVKLEVIGDA